MISCEKIQEMISSMLDNELNNEERAKVEEHIALCPECAAMYEDFSALSISLKEEFSAVPAALHENIMSGVKAKRKKAKIIPLRSYLSAAACLVLVVGAVLAVGNGRGYDKAVPAAPAAPPDPGAPAAVAAEAPMAPDMDYFILERNESNYGAAPIPAPTLEPNIPAEPAAPAEPAEPFWEMELATAVYIPGAEINSAIYEYSIDGAIGSGHSDGNALAALLGEADIYSDGYSLHERADAWLQLDCCGTLCEIRLYFTGEKVIVETSEGLYTAVGTTTQFIEIFQ